MAITKKLKLVLSENGSEPLVFESCWEDGGDPEPILLLDEHVDGTVRRRAICILLLLAKLPRLENVGSDGIIPFKDECTFPTWIQTLGEWKRPALESWVKKHFGIIRSDQHFMVSHPGSKKKGKQGKRYPNVQYNSKNLPLENLDLFTRSSSIESSPDTELSGVWLLDAALKLEAQHWNVTGNNSCIRELLKTGKLRLPEDIMQEAKRVGILGSGITMPGTRMTADNLFERTEEQLLKQKVSVARKNHVAIFYDQLKADFLEHSRRCDSFHKLMSEHRKMFSKGFHLTMNRFQADLFRCNCSDYSHLLFGTNRLFPRHLKVHFKKEKYFDEPENSTRWIEMQDVVQNIFFRFSDEHKLPRAKLTSTEVSSGRIPEEGAMWELFGFSTFRKSRYFILGAFAAHRVIFERFLTNICIPRLYCLKTKAEEEFRNNVLDVTLGFNHLMYSRMIFCDDNPRHEFDFIIGFRTVLKADALFWSGLQERLNKLANP